MSQSRRFLCHVLHKHHYKLYSTEDGNRYRACSYCHKESPSAQPAIWLSGGGV